MVKGVVGEERRLQLAEDRLSQSNLPVEVGLVIGKLSSALDRGFVFDLIPTPPNDAGEAPSSIIKHDTITKKGSNKPPAKSNLESSSLFIDKDWVAEHARQVSRMLVGGVKVVGIYVWASDVTFKNSTVLLCQTVKEVADAAPLPDSGSDERLLIHICYSPRRWTCRNCSFASNITSNNLRPCDFKMGRVLTSIQGFRCNYSFNVRLPIYQENSSSPKTLNNVLQDAVMIHAKELRNAKAIIDGNLVIKDGPVSSDGLHEVELLMPFMNDIAVEERSDKVVVGILDFAGSVCSYSYLNSKEPCSQALADIKEDIITCLKSRLDIISDEADSEKAIIDASANEGNNEESAEGTGNLVILQPLRKQCSLEFPRRVFIPWLGGIYICDYLQPSETLEDIKGHFSELLSMEAPDDESIVQPERQAPSLSTKSFWDAVSPLTATSSSKSVSGRSTDLSASNTTNAKATTHVQISSNIVALVVLLLSVLVGLFLYAYHL